MELLFLFCFSLHNLEEAIWLPAWSKYAKRYHAEVKENEFRFAVIVITAMGYLITFQYFLLSSNSLSKFIYSGFILMMVVNVIFPHLLAAVMLRRYAPGLITGVLLNLPVGIYILRREITNLSDMTGIVIASVIISIITLFSLKYLFLAGGKLNL